jgi:hypothetical protein
MTAPRLPATFLALQERSDVDAADLMETLRHYAVNGAAISADVVRSIAMRTPLDLDQMAHLAESAELGAHSQRSRGFVRDAAAYDKISDLLRGMASARGMRP